MKNITLSPDNELTVRFPRELRQHAQQIAVQQGETLSDLVCRAVSSYLTAYSAKYQPASQTMGLDEARQLMQRLGQGLGEGMSPHNAARHHDEYLCKK
jgi:hypothetical protein